VLQNRVQYQEGLSLLDFIQAYGTEEKCLAALELASWPEGFRCPQCGEGEKVGVIHDNRRKGYQCNQCLHQTTATAETIFDSTKLPLSKMSDENRPIYLRLNRVSGITSDAIEAWSQESLAPGCLVVSDGLGCFGAVAAAGCDHVPVVIGGRKPKDVPLFQWLNTIIGNVKTALSGTHLAFNFKK
jgi:hypothetical protein